MSYADVAKGENPTPYINIRTLKVQARNPETHRLPDLLEELDIAGWGDYVKRAAPIGQRGHFSLTFRTMKMKEEAQKGWQEKIDEGKINFLLEDENGNRPVANQTLVLLGTPEELPSSTIALFMRQFFFFFFFFF